jgi:ABC-type branched-subunit amino acid transport system substrate-binding protein
VANKIPLVCSSAPTANIVPVNPWVYIGKPLADQGAAPAIDFATKTLHLGSGSTFATYAGDSAGPVAQVQGLTKGAQAAGMKKVAAELVPLTAVNGNTQIADLVAAKPDLVMGQPAQPQIAPLVHALRAAGNNAPVILAISADSYSDLQALGDPNVYQLSPSQFVTSLTPSQSGAADLVAAMKLEGQTTLDQINPLLNGTYPWAYAILQGLKACGYPCDGTTLQSKLDQVSFSLPGLVDHFAWTPTSHVPYATLYIVGYDTASKQMKVIATPTLTPPSS